MLNRGLGGELSAIAGAPTEQQGRARLLRWISTHHGSRAEPEDLLHDAFVRFEQLKRKTSVADPVGFLLHTAANLNIDRYRRRRRFVCEPLESACARIADPAPAMDEVLSVRAQLERVQSALDALSVRTRTVFLMHRLDGRKHREIAVMLGISQSAVEKHIAKASLRLAGSVEEP